MRRIPARLWLLAVVSALLQLLPFPLAGPVGTGRRMVCWFCLVPLLAAIVHGCDKAGKPLRPLQGAYIGYLCGVLWYMGNCYWIYQTMYLYGGLPKPVSLGILILFSLYLGLYLALFGGLLAWVRGLTSVRTAVWVSPFLWVAVELARARITGFPWDLLGYTQVDNLVLTKLAPVTGVMGLSFLVAAVNALWLMKREKEWRLAYAGPLAALALVGVVTTLGVVGKGRIEPTTASATLVQENLSVGAERVGPSESKAQMLAAFSALSEKPPVGGTPTASELILWPEAPTPFVDSDPEFRQAMGALAAGMKQPVIVDAVSFASRSASANGHAGRYNLYNSASFFRADGSYAGHYDKMHLVPFGEYTPYKWLFFFAGSLLDDLPFVPGQQRTMLDANRKRYGVFICYESIFGDEIRRFVGDGAQVLVNLSDDGWYGDTSAPWEHLDMVRMRAIENRRWVLRSTNTGVTAAIDPEGRITETLPRHVRSAMVVRFDYKDGLTLYTRWGDWFAWLCVAVSAVVLGWGLWRVRFAAPVEVN